jgi:P27 family predicted phage terminase small subunit
MPTSEAAAYGANHVSVAKPAHLKLLEGNPGKRSIPIEPRPEISETIPEAPPFLTVDAHKEWDHIATQLHRLGLLTVVDVASLAAYCQAYGRWLTAERAIAAMAERDLLTGGLMIKTTNGNAIQNPLIGTANKAASDMVRYASEFGLTPAARARIGFSTANAQKSKFDGLIR